MLSLFISLAMYKYQPRPFLRVGSSALLVNMEHIPLKQALSSTQAEDAPLHTTYITSTVTLPYCILAEVTQIS